MYRLTASFKSCCSVVGALESVTPSLGAGVVFVVRYQKPLSSVTARKEGVCGVVGREKARTPLVFSPFLVSSISFVLLFVLLPGWARKREVFFLGVRFTDV